jgi:hypothetical protein
LAHERGGVGDLGDVAAGGGDLEVVEVGAAKDDAGAGGRGDEAQGDFYAGVETDALEVEGDVDGLFELEVVGQAGGSRTVALVRLYRVVGGEGVANQTQVAGQGSGCGLVWFWS